jgi:cytochrome P450
MSDSELRELVDRFDYSRQEDSDRLYEVMGYARTHCPVPHTTADPGYFIATRYEDVRAVVEDTETFCSGMGVNVKGQGGVKMPPLDSDPPIHRDFRQLLNRYLSRNNLQQYESVVRQLAADTVEPWLDRGHVEFVSEFAGPFTGSVLARVVLNAEDTEDVLAAHEASIRASTHPSEESYGALAALVVGFLEKRQKAQVDRDDILHAVNTGQVQGRPLTDEERLGVVMVMFLGGLDTTRIAIANIAANIARTPELEARVRQPDWMAGDLDEFLRYESPVSAMSRTVTRDATLNGVALHQGDQVMVHFASANRDEQQFEKADQLDFGRTRNPHLAFGMGIHRCIGSNLARLQIAIGFEELFKRVTNLRMEEGETIRYSPGVSRGPERLVLRFDRSEV